MIVTEKQYENPETGRFNATIIDIQDLGPKDFKGNTVVMLAIFWLLDKNDSEGKPFRVRQQVSAKMTGGQKKSKLYEIAMGVFGGEPNIPKPFDTELLIGRSAEITVVRETGNNGKVYANPKIYLPLPAGAVAPQAPQGFVRAKDRVPGQQFGASAAPAVAVNTAPAIVVNTAANTVASTPTAQPTVQGQANPAQATQAPGVQVDAAF